MVNSRNKGSAYERSICQLFNLELGSQFNFKRDLEQYRAADHGDIISDDPTWPFVVELKRYASGPPGGQIAWWTQAVNAATAAKKLPVLIYKYDRADPIAVIQKRTIARALGEQSALNAHSIVRYWCEVPEFLTIAREVMAYDAA